MKHLKNFAPASKLTLRAPTAEDGTAIWALIRACKPLDENSMYCNLIQCDHFADTCVLAELDGDVVGWISAYVMPNAPDTLFVWQVAVSERARGMGLGGRMLESLLDRTVCQDVSRLQTTITNENDASWALFRKFGRTQGTQIQSRPHFDQTLHFDNRHKTENLVTIPLSARLAKAA